MKFVEKLAALAGKYMAVIVLIVTCISLFFSQAMTWIKVSWVNPLLMIVMLGMGLTLKMSDFAECFKKPKGVIGQTILRFVVTPFIALGLSKIFKLSPELTVGFLLVAVCPGGTASNVMTYLAKGGCSPFCRNDGGINLSGSGADANAYLAFCGGKA